MTNNIMTSQSDIERIVMRRVHLIRILQLVISTVVLVVLTLVVALWGIGKEVWVARVFENAPSNAGDLPNFYIAAFSHARFIVQVLTILTLASFVFLAREVVRLIISAVSAPPGPQNDDKA